MKPGVPERNCWVENCHWESRFGDESGPQRRWKFICRNSRMTDRAFIRSHGTFFQRQMTRNLWRRSRFAGITIGSMIIVNFTTRLGDFIPRFLPPVNINVDFKWIRQTRIDLSVESFVIFFIISRIFSEFNGEWNSNDFVVLQMQSIHFYYRGEKTHNQEITRDITLLPRPKLPIFDFHERKSSVLCTRSIENKPRELSETV